MLHISKNTYFLFSNLHKLIMCEGVNEFSPGQVRWITFYLFKDTIFIRFFDIFFIRARIITKLSDNFGKLSKLG